ncbi:MAG: hypothetical protein V2A64_04805 [Candidatus Omnitrophota bacterium]
MVKPIINAFAWIVKCAIIKMLSRKSPSAITYPACRLPVGRQGRQVSPVISDFRSPSRFDLLSKSGGGLGKILYTFLYWDKKLL